MRRVPANHGALIDRTGNRCLATTDPKTMTIYASDWLRGGMLDRVLIHEMAHCVIWSYGLFPEIRAFTRPDRQIQAEEWICNFLADYGLEVFNDFKKVMGRDAIISVPIAMERLVA